jgi:3-oxoacyl-[acyl-carrier-protein] synthase III
MIRSQVIGCGAYLPRRIVTNAELAGRLTTSDEWIAQRTGIRQRHIVAEGETTGDMATAAAEAALRSAGVEPEEVDLLLLATSTPDHTFPGTSTQVQARLGMQRGAAFDIQAVCSGFVFALATADNFIKAGQARAALVVGAESFSRILDWNDRGTCVLFGDGAGAVLLRAGEGNGNAADRGVLTTHIYSDGRYYKLLYVDGGPSATQTTGHVKMEGREVFRHAVVKMGEAVDAAIAAMGISGRDVDWLVPHQANRRIIDSMGQRLHLPPEKVIITVDKHANTSAASIPLALTQAVEDGRIRPGHMVLIEAMGGGFTWGSALIRW